ncbi:glycosyltransferase family 2 protein [Dysgonomonas sp. 520]|uniref:glycosyltransferase family 2 protein n=1 Tax=Dysgonomonas sp. 520 TaxID=2302931 RepID=UPI0013D69F0D|nr:glycosyltransferase family 2 protein [Dysgonomonas sp. 520]NDW08108.1 glycosyltransferase [Dysgonomonas sp. 520]
MHKISIIIPCYNEEEALPYLYKELEKVTKVMSEQEFEFIFVNDGSKDKTLDVFRELRAKDERVRYVSFSRNFGKEAAIFAGLETATGDYVATIDADLQDPPMLLEEMYKTLQTEDYDCVATRREDRKGEPIIRSFFARKFYQLINNISDTKLVDGARDFRLMTRQMVDSILELREYNRFSKGIFGWVGYNTKWISYENVERVAGKTKWSFWGLFFYSLEGIIAFSTRPLAIASLFGILFFIISLVFIAYIVTKTLLWGDPVAGFPTLICGIFFIGGIQLLCLGILGQYLSRLYLEVKRRPIYIVKETEKSKIK